MNTQPSAAAAIPDTSGQDGPERKLGFFQLRRGGGSPVWLGGLLLGMALIVPMHPAALDAVELPR
jgi:hypothetical protein